MADLVYEAGDVALWHGTAEWLTMLADETVAAIVTSPPYNLGPSKHLIKRVEGPLEIGQARVVSDRTARGTYTKQELRPRYESYNDDLPEAEYQAWQVRCLAEWWRVCRDGASLFYNHRPRIRDGRLLHPLDWLKAPGQPWLVRSEIIWASPRGEGRHRERTLFVDEHELIYWLTKGRPDPRPDAQPWGTVWDMKPVAAKDGAAGWHPTPFPVALPARCISALALEPRALVLDPFVGSGTTLVAAMLAGLRGIGVDSSRRYLERAAQRLGQRVLLVV